MEGSTSLSVARLCTRGQGQRPRTEAKDPGLWSRSEGSSGRIVGVSFLGKLLGRDRDDEDEGPEVLITIDAERRRPQLLRLEQSLDALAAAMREAQSVDNPGWRGRVNEYSRLAGEAMLARKGTPTREQLLDLVFEVRPVFAGPVPAGLETLGPLQDEVMAAAEDLRELLPHERG